MKEITKLMYIIVDKKNNAHPNTLRFYRKECIDDFLINKEGYTWNDAKEFGWKCEKVEVIIRPLSNIDGWNAYFKK